MVSFSCFYVDTAHQRILPKFGSTMDQIAEPDPRLRPDFLTLGFSPFYNLKPEPSQRCMGIAPLGHGHVALMLGKRWPPWPGGQRNRGSARSAIAGMGHTGI